jgi:hypothetical protein
MSHEQHYPRRRFYAAIPIAAVLLGAVACGSASSAGGFGDGSGSGFGNGFGDGSGSETTAAPETFGAPETTAAPQAGSGDCQTQSLLAVVPPAMVIRKPNGLCAFGAPLLVWDAYHTVDPNSTMLAYDQDSSLPPGPGGEQDKYSGVNYVDGLIWNYDVNFPSGTTLAGAETLVKAEFPSDVQVDWTKTLTQCAVAEYTSATLGSDLGIGADSLNVEFQSPGLFAPYDPQTIGLAELNVGGGTEAQVSGC